MLVGSTFLSLAEAMSEGSAPTSQKFLKMQHGEVQLGSEQLLGLTIGSALEDVSDIVIQFQNVLTESDKTWLQSKGFQVLRYLPDDAVVVRASAAQIIELAEENKDRILGVTVYQPTWRLNEQVLQSLTAQPFSTRDSLTSFEILCFNAQDANSVFTQLVGPEFRQASVDGRLVNVVTKLEMARELARWTGVEHIQFRPKVSLMHIQLLDRTSEDSNLRASAGRALAGDYTDLNGFETGTKVMNMEAAWNAGYRGAGQIVSFADTGLDRGTIETVSVDFSTAVSSGLNFGLGAKTWADPMGHGTHVAGSIAGRGTFSGGKLQGAAPQAMLLPEGMWSPILENLTVPPKLEKLFGGALQGGAQLHSNSWGSPANLGAYDNMAVQVDEFSWNNLNFLPIFAAGNSGVDKNKDGVIDAGSVSTPGTSKNALTVGASENLLSTGGIQRKISELRNAADNWGAEPISSSKLSDNVNGVAVFSSRGPTRDGRLKPEIVAPGTNILSARSHETGAQELWGAYNADYTYSGGTSMATPLAAGAAAVIREILVKEQRITNPSAALVKAAMMVMATDMAPGQYGTGATQELKNRPENNQGYGKVDLQRFLSLKSTAKFIESAGVGAGESLAFKMPTSAGQKVSAVLVYTDAPGSPAASQALVNDLDLSLNGKSANDHINNHEYGETISSGGDVTVNVSGTRVPMGKAGKQPFALVITVQ